MHPFSARSYTINCQKQYLLRLNGVNELIDCLHHSSPNLLQVIKLTDPFVAFWVIAVDAIVDNTVQVHVKVI
jgi:hypothetical protein